MKIMNNKFFIVIPILLLTMILYTQCTKVLDKSDLSAIPEQAVWNDVNLATAYVNRLYLDIMPVWQNNSGESDEAAGGTALMYGQYTENSVDYWTNPYSFIRNVNILLRDVAIGKLTVTDQNSLKGQALFLRAWQYFQLVSRYGGVPLILKPQGLDEDLKVSRNKTSECITQIIKDLDDAAALLPNSWTGTEQGRITKGAALAVKGRVLLHFASEQYDPTQSASGRWTAAYDANKIAKDINVTAGKALLSNFKEKYITEGVGNTEAIFVTRFNNPGRTHNHDACARPLDEAQNCTGADQPTLAMVQAYPMINGLPITDPASGYNPNAFWLNRDPRFAATIAYNGCLWELSGKSGRIQWTFTGSQQTGGSNGFYCRKGLFEGYKSNETEISGTDWIELSFAEVLMNLAESANETGKTSEAYDVLISIRKRAGIEIGVNGMYGLKSGMTKVEMREAILQERRLEFAFEGKRAQDMRRRRLYASMNGTRRKGLDIKLIAFSGDKPAFYKAYAAGSVNLNTNYSTYFTDVVKELDQNTNVINYKSEYYCYAIPLTHIEKNVNLLQTKGWTSGTFDPLL